ncbi:MAG TPA: hypothetical protein VGJ70_13500, partial [Solirubrobacteraceae bacterium]
ETTAPEEDVPVAGDLPAAAAADTVPVPVPVQEEPPVAEVPAAPEPEPAPAPVVPEEQPEPAPAHGAPSPAAEAAVVAMPVARRVRRDAAPQAKPVAAPAPVSPPRDAPLPLDPEAHLPGAVVWLNRQLPDPTPPSLRLSTDVANRLVMASGRTGARWELVLGLLRADGSRGVPDRGRTIDDAAETLAGADLDREGWAVALNASGRTAAADRALALARYYRAIGYDGLVGGLLASEDALAERVLNDGRVSIYEGGRGDIAAGHVDVRVLAVIEYLAETFGSVTVSCLVTGHHLYARPGVISAHIYGRAVDIAALGGVSIAGNQEPGSVTEQAVRDLLLLPAEVLPRQVISLLGLGGPSFPLADHDDHIHIGF